MREKDQRYHSRRHQQGRLIAVSKSQNRIFLIFKNYRKIPNGVSAQRLRLCANTPEAVLAGYIVLSLLQALGTREKSRCGEQTRLACTEQTRTTNRLRHSIGTVRKPLGQHAPTRVSLHIPINTHFGNMNFWPKTCQLFGHTIHTILGAFWAEIHELSRRKMQILGSG